MEKTCQQCNCGEERKIISFLIRPHSKNFSSFCILPNSSIYLYRYRYIIQVGVWAVKAEKPKRIKERQSIKKNKMDGSRVFYNSAKQWNPP